MTNLPRNTAPDPLRENIIKNIKTVFDPEIPVDVWELGLIYDIKIKPIEGSPLKEVDLQMTLTTPNCPVAETLPEQVRQAVLLLDEIDKVKLELVWEPTWESSRMSDFARIELGMFF